MTLNNHCPIFDQLMARFGGQVRFSFAHNPSTRLLGLDKEGAIALGDDEVHCGIFLGHDHLGWFSYGAIQGEPFFGDDEADIFLGFVNFKKSSTLRICEDVLDPLQQWMRDNVPFHPKDIASSSFVNSTGHAWDDTILELVDQVSGLSQPVLQATSKLRHARDIVSEYQSKRAEVM